MTKIFKLLNEIQKKYLFIIIILLILLSLLELLTFSLLQPIINYFTDKNNLNISYIYKINFFKNITIFDLLGIFFVIFLLRGLLNIYISYRKHGLVRNINNTLSKKIFLNYLNQNFSFFVDNNSAKMISNIINEVEKLSYRLIDSLIGLATEIFIIVAILAFLFLNYFKGTIILGSSVIIFFSVFYYYFKSKFKRFGEDKTLYDSIKINDLQSSFYAIQLIKLENLEEYFSSKFNHSTGRSSDSQFYLSFISELPKPLIEFLVLVIIFFILFIFYFFFNISKSEIITMLGLFVVAMFRLLPSTNKVIGCLNAVKFYSSSVEIINNEINRKIPAIDQQEIKNIFFTFNKSIKLNNVSFSHESKNDFILKNVNMTINKCDMIAILGENGSGKSTLLNIISYLLRPKSGNVLIDDVQVDQFYRAYQAKIGYVQQKTILIDDSLIRNVIFGKKESEYNLKLFEEIIETLNLQKFLKKLPNGKDTLLGERGSQLSGGEMQKIGIARALYKKPEILLLDEATSALDEQSEKEILKTIQSLKGKITIIIVTHKKNILDYCDKIYSLSQGNIIQVNK
jgi:ABC-type multidrug transport system fused ATPase/permease subunit